MEYQGLARSALIVWMVSAASLLTNAGETARAPSISPAELAQKIGERRLKVPEYKMQQYWRK